MKQVQVYAHQWLDNKDRLGALEKERARLTVENANLVGKMADELGATVDTEWVVAVGPHGRGVAIDPWNCGGREVRCALV